MGEEYSNFDYYKTLSFLLFSSVIIAFKSGIGRKLVTDNNMWLGVFDNLLWGLVFIFFSNCIKRYGIYRFINGIFDFIYC